MKLNKADFKLIMDKAKARKWNRAIKRSGNEALKAIAASAGGPPRPAKPKQEPKPIKRLIKRGALKSAIIRLLGLLDKKYNGPLCRLGEFCPRFQTEGHHYGTLAYHIVPAMRGDATRFLQMNVIWACSSANYGEVMNRSLYREKHVLLFGKDRVEGIEKMAREIKQYKMSELLEMREQLRKELEGK